MARVAFISLYDRNAYGLRLMSAILKKYGHECHVIFLKRYSISPAPSAEVEPGEYPWTGIGKSGRAFRYAANSPITGAEFDHLGGLLDEIGPDVVGLTVNTPLRVQAAKVTAFIKGRVKMPVVWGGYDPTVNAPDCLAFCDYVCIGEGDRAILDIADRLDGKQSLDNVRNLAFMQGSKMVVNEMHPLEHDLDSLPWRDDSPERKYFIEDNRLERNCADVNDRPSGMYLAISARGCPHRCSYCCEAALKDLYAGEKFLRRRSPESIIAELAEAKRRFNITRIQFEDEIFSIDVKWLEQFVPLYKSSINVPLTAYFFPTRQFEQSLRLLQDAGLAYCCLALQSGSERINADVFSRPYNRERFLEACALCRQLGIGFYTDVITYNPYEEEEDLRKTLDVLIAMRGRYDLCVNKLFVLPGTALAARMERDAISVDMPEKTALFDYYSRLFWIASFTRFSRGVINVIEKMGVFRRHPAWLNPAIVEVLVAPMAVARSVVRQMLPARAVAAMQGWRARRRRAL